MSPDEVEILQQVGQVIIEDLSRLVTQAVLYGLYLAIFGFGIRALLKRKPRTKHTWALLGFLSVLCLIYTANLASYMTFVVRLIRGGLIENPEEPLIVRLELADESTAVIDICTAWFGDLGSGLLFVFADAVVVWRAYVLWPGNNLVRVLLSGLLLVSFGIAIVASIVSSIVVNTAGDTVFTGLKAVILPLGLSLSLTTNLVATALIACRAHRYRNMMKASLSVARSKTGAILLFLTESGSVFCVLQAITIALGLAAPDDPKEIWLNVMEFVTVAYPVLVLIIVDSHRSIANHTGGRAFADSGGPRNSQALGVGSHVSFADRSGISSTDMPVTSKVGSFVDPNLARSNTNAHYVDKSGGSEKGETIVCVERVE